MTFREAESLNKQSISFFNELAAGNVSINGISHDDSINNLELYLDEVQRLGAEAGIFFNNKHKDQATRICFSLDGPESRDNQGFKHIGPKDYDLTVVFTKDNGRNRMDILYSQYDRRNGKTYDPVCLKTVMDDKDKDIRLGAFAFEHPDSKTQIENIIKSYKNDGEFNYEGFFAPLIKNPQNLKNWERVESKRFGCPVHCERRPDGGIRLSYELGEHTKTGTLTVDISNDLDRPRIDFNLTSDLKVNGRQVYNNLCVHTIFKKNDLDNNLNYIERVNSKCLCDHHRMDVLKFIISKYNEDGLRDIHNRYPNKISKQASIVKKFSKSVVSR